MNFYKKFIILTTNIFKLFFVLMNRGRLSLVGAFILMGLNVTLFVNYWFWNNSEQGWDKTESPEKSEYEINNTYVPEEEWIYLNFLMKENLYESLLKVKQNQKVSEYLDSLWNNNTKEIIENYISQSSCKDLQDGVTWEDLYQDYNLNQRILDNQLKKFLGCYSHQNYTMFDLLEDREKRSEFSNRLDNLWSNNTKDIWKNYINRNSCKELKTNKLYSSEEESNKNGILSDKTLKKYIGCNMKKNKKYQVSSTITADYKEYREVNIWWGLNTMQDKVRKEGETISVYDYLTQFDGYIDWRAVIEWEKVMVWWGWVCGVSTVAYRVFSELVDVEVLERHNHSILNIDSFGKKWFDASVFWDWVTPDLDLVASNNHWKIFVDTISEPDKQNNKYKYWMKLYSWQPFEKYDISFSDAYEENWRTCVDKILKNQSKEREVQSCYVDIIEDDDI